MPGQLQRLPGHRRLLAGDPKLISHPKCNGDQGDIVVYEDILVRSWNTKRAEPRECGDTMVPAGFEGVHVWDISDPVDPELLGALELPCGSHTATSLASMTVT